MNVSAMAGIMLLHAYARQDIDEPIRIAYTARKGSGGRWRKMETGGITPNALPCPVPKLRDIGKGEIESDKSLFSSLGKYILKNATKNRPETSN